MTSNCPHRYNEAGVYCNGNYSFDAVTYKGSGSKTVLTVITTALLQAPKEVSVIDINDKSFNVSWISPAVQTHGTSIENYNVTCLEVGQLEVVYKNSSSNYSRWLLVDGLQPCSRYNCCVSAFNTAGEGRQLCDTGETLANGKYICQPL